MAGNVRAVPGIPQMGPRPDFCSEIYQFAEAITQIAVRILFIMGTILMTGAVLPITWHAVAVPVVAIGTTALAGFFYPLPNPIRGPLFARLQALVRPVDFPVNGELPAHFPADSPRGLRNAGQNCAFNAMAHYLDSDPEIARWVRHPLTDDIDLPAFQNFLAEYDPPPHLVQQFNEFVGRAPVPHPPIPDLFAQFLEAYQPPLADRAAYNEIRTNYHDLRLLQGPFSEFFRANDAAVEGRQAVSGGNSQNLRLALNRVTALVDPSPYVQMDVEEAVRPLLRVVPNRLKARIETVYHYNENVTRLYPMLERPVATEERVGDFSLAINGEGPVSLQTLFENYCNDDGGAHEPHEPQKFYDVNGVRREYPVDRVTVSLLEAPPALRFHIKRFSHEVPPVSWWSKWFPSFFPLIPWRDIKLQTLIHCPGELTVTLKNGEVCRYRLACPVNHHGVSCGGGHYTAGRIVNGRKFLMNDEHVTLDPANWNEQLQHAYLLCYVRVPDPVPAEQ